MPIAIQEELMMHGSLPSCACSHAFVLPFLLLSFFLPPPEPSDIDLAVESRLSESLTSPPSKELLFGLAATRNLVPLPLVPTKEGVHLPSERYCLMQPNYRVKTTPPTGGAGRRDDRSHS